MSKNLEKAIKMAESKVIAENPVNLDSEAMSILNGGQRMNPGLFETISAECRGDRVSCHDRKPTNWEILQALLH
ncbi:MAG: hypothetical protein IK022_07570 [Bacteroidales bacterium]|nr:hypothetical protein [Bacteroidales bacterium]